MYVTDHKPCRFLLVFNINKSEHWLLNIILYKDNSEKAIIHNTVHI